MSDDAKGGNGYFTLWCFDMDSVMDGGMVNQCQYGKLMDLQLR